MGRVFSKRVAGALSVAPAGLLTSLYPASTAAIGRYKGGGWLAVDAHLDVQVDLSLDWLLFVKLNAPCRTFIHDILTVRCGYL